MRGKNLIALIGRIVELLHEFHEQPATLMMSSIPDGSFEKKLYSMYLSYLPEEKVAFDLDMKCDVYIPQCEVHLHGI